jgi:hypothetical protein
MIRTKNSVTFHIETLERPKKLVEEKPFSEIVKTFSDKVEFLPNPDAKLIPGGYHSFIYGLYLAYSEHRPFTLSPDMIWLLVLQGISNHVNFSHESGNNIFPNFTDKKKIVIQNDKIKIGDPSSPWGESIEEFSNEIEEIFGSEMIGDLRSDFSTTTAASKVVSEITIMDTFKAYFKYIVFTTICGIPEMKLEGTTDDWNHLLNKLQILKKYDMEWWYNDLKPILTNIKNTSKENIDTDFWMQMFKIHTIEEYGNPKYIDGWITKFYPYDRSGKRFDISKISMLSVEDIFKELPKQVVTVDFKHQLKDNFGNIIGETPLEYWGGFVGISQNHNTQFLKPEIGWFVSHPMKTFEKDVDAKREANEYYQPSKAYYNLTKIPDEVFKEKRKWDVLSLDFLGKCTNIARMKEIEFSALYLNGDIDDEAIKHIEASSNVKRKYILINGKRLGENNLAREVYEKHLKHIEEEYIPKSGRSKYVQGELLRTIRILREAAAHINYDESRFGKLITYLEDHLYDEAVFTDSKINNTYLALYGLQKKDRSLEEDPNPTFSDEYDYIEERIVDLYLHYGSVKCKKN